MSPSFLSICEGLNYAFWLNSLSLSFSLWKNSLYLFSIFSLCHFRKRGPDRLRNFWFHQSLPKIKHNVVNNSNPIIIIQKAKYTIKRKKKQKKMHKHKQIHNLSLKNILFQTTKNPFKKKKIN